MDYSWNIQNPGTTQSEHVLYVWDEQTPLTHNELQYLNTHRCSHAGWFNRCGLFQRNANPCGFKLNFSYTLTFSDWDHFHCSFILVLKPLEQRWDSLGTETRLINTVRPFCSCCCGHCTTIDVSQNNILVNRCVSLTPKAHPLTIPMS